MLYFRLQHIYFVALYGLFFPDPKSRNEEIMAFDGVTIACVISELKKNSSAADYIRSPSRKMMNCC